jgi:hypothetical protein
MQKFRLRAGDGDLSGLRGDRPVEGIGQHELDDSDLSGMQGFRPQIVSGL